MEASVDGWNACNTTGNISKTPVLQSFLLLSFKDGELSKIPGYNPASLTVEEVNTVRRTYASVETIVEDQAQILTSCFANCDSLIYDVEQAEVDQGAYLLVRCILAPDSRREMRFFAAVSHKTL